MTMRCYNRCMRIEYHREFKRDVRKWRKAGWDMGPFELFLTTLRREWPLPTRYQAHRMVGNMAGTWDAHIRQDWVVFFRKENDCILLLRTGTHAYLGIG